MDNNLVQENAVVAIRVSSMKQGLQGDSPDDQQIQLERFAAAHNINIKKYFVFIESASKEQQPVQEAIDYCKNPKNNIQLFIVKSIDRFTRGGSFFYEDMKTQLVKYGVKLIDIYGIIGNQEVNTLEHLGIEFNWSVYSPTKKAEILEAERAKDEIRDILTRMIGAEIRYVRMGYRVRPSPFGYINTKIDTTHGKRVILTPHNEESVWMIKMFEFRARLTMSDIQIVEEINKLGFKTRLQYLRDPNDRTKVIGEKGGKKLDLKHFWRFIQNPIYAGINTEKWTEGQPIKGKFKGLVSVEMFNKANKGKVIITENEGEIKIYKDKPADYLLKKCVKNPDFAYKRYVMCPECAKPLYGSAPRGRNKKRYPAYHCDKRGHYFRISTQLMNDTVVDFVRSLQITPEYAEQLKTFVQELWEKRQTEIQGDTSHLDNKVAELKVSAKAIVEKMRFLNSEIAIKYMEEDLVKIEQEMKELEMTKAQKSKQEVDMKVVMDNIEYFLRNLENLLLGSPDRLKKAAYFGLIFNQAPTYQELILRNASLAPYLKLKEQFEQGLLPNCEPSGI